MGSIFFKSCDVVIVEGFKFEEEFPKVVVGELDEDVKDKIVATLTVKGKEDYNKVLNWVLDNLNL